MIVIEPASGSTGRTGVVTGAVAVCSLLLAFAVFWGPPQLRGWDTVDVEWQSARLGNDAAAYIDIAVQLAKGHGLSEDPADPSLQLLLSEGAATGAEPDSGRQFPSTRWPPMFPALLALLFWMFGFDITLAHVLNAALMAAAAAVLTTFLFRRHGPAPAITAFVLFTIVDVRTRDYARLVMTEPLATLLVTITACIFIAMAGSRPLLAAAGAGIVWGAAILARSVFILWLPGLVLLVWWLVRAPRLRSEWYPLRASLAFLGAALVTASPWFVHNSRALGAFMPLGSHVYTLPSGFSEEAWQTGGVWAKLPNDNFASIDDPADPPTVSARKRADYGRSQALEWIAENPVRAIWLGVKKAMAIWFPERSVEMSFLVLPMIGLVAMRRSAEGTVLVALLTLNTLAIAATWTFQGDRFQVPMLALLHYAAAVGLWSIRVKVVQSSQ